MICDMIILMRLRGFKGVRVGSDEGLTIAYVLRRWAGIQASAGRGQDAYTLKRAAITLERVVAERDRLQVLMQDAYYEGYSDGERRDPGGASRGWKHSDTRAELEEAGDET